MKKLDDPVILERFKNGDTSAFKEIVIAYQDNIYELCFRMLGDRDNAQDAAQETFLKAYQGIGRFEPDASIYTWLYRIGVNTCIDYKRRSALESFFRRPFSSGDAIEQEPSDAPSPERLAESKQAAAALQKALGKLSHKLRAVIVMKEIEELSYEDIAKVLDISLGTVKSRISRAREELKRLVAETHL